MKDLLNPEGAFFQFLSRIGDLIILNFLFLVCCIPVDGEVDLKKAAKAAGDKKVEMLPMKDLLAVTGYVRGGCSPIGMKKRFPTYLDSSALQYETITVSAGQRGAQVILSPEDLMTLVGAKATDLM